jgi:flagellin-like protein
MKTKMKMLRSKKALSPVIATIILIAVTVAVSLAVAAWMGALTFSFTSTEQITYTSYTWTTGTSGSDPKIALTVENTGSGTLTIANVEVDGVTANYTLTLLPSGTPVAAPGTLTLTKGSSAKIVIMPTGGFSSGVQYNFLVVTAKGNQFGPYTLPAP